MDEDKSFVSRLEHIESLLSQKARIDNRIRKLNIQKGEHVPIYAQPIKPRFPLAKAKRDEKQGKGASKPKKLKKLKKKTVKKKPVRQARQPTNLELAELQATKQALERVIRATKTPKRFTSQEAQTNRALLIDSNETKKTTLDRHVTFLENKDARAKKKFFLIWENRWYRQSMKRMKDTIRERMSTRQYKFAKTESHRKRKQEVSPEMKDIEESSSEGPPLYDDGEVQFSFSSSGSATKVDSALGSSISPRQAPLEKLDEPMKQSQTEKTRDSVKQAPAEKLDEPLKQAPVEKARESVKQVPVEKLDEPVRQEPLKVETPKKDEKETVTKREAAPAGTQKKMEAPAEKAPVKQAAPAQASAGTKQKSSSDSVVLESGNEISDDRFTASDFEKAQGSSIEVDEFLGGSGSLFESSGIAEKDIVQVKTFPAEEEKKQPEAKAKTGERRVQMIVPEFYHQRKAEQERAKKEKKAEKFSFDSIPTVEPEGNQEADDKADTTPEKQDSMGESGSFGSDIVFESSDVLAKIGDEKNSSFVGSFSDEMDLPSIGRSPLTGPTDITGPSSDSLSFDIDSPK